MKPTLLKTLIALYGYLYPNENYTLSIMENLYIVIFSGYSIILFACALVKLNYFIRAGRDDFPGFVKSFFKTYGQYRIVNASERVRLYMKASNIVNRILWLSTLLITGIVVFWGRLRK